MADEGQLRDYLRRVTVELADERGRLHALRHEPIAIVGMSCRYPGGVSSPDDLWALLAGCRDGISKFPADRNWQLGPGGDRDLESHDANDAHEGGFLYDAGEFDPEFFNISPREAIVLDPQQRLLLEGAWEALEDAGIDPASLRGTEAGVFAGVMYQDYGSIEDGVAPGMTTGVVSGRVAYALGLEGPAITVDTACSSSLVALHLASQALRGGECSLALAGGVSVLSTPSVFTEFSRQRGLARDGRCKSFAEAADGTGFSEGIGVIVLERLSDAQANGHHVLATIRGSAINQDGASNGLTAPNGPSQERVIRQALANARLTTKDVDMVEAHGTGTTLGDPIEAGALLATYGQEREAPLRLGSLKSNIGHTQAAAGVGGVIKAVLAMREGTMPKTLHVDAPSTKVDWEAGEIELLTEAQPWEPNGHPRRAAVSSFGYSGTNAHLILEEAPAPAEVKEEDGGEQPLQGPIPLALSAKSPEALAESAERLATHLKANPGQDLTDTAFSLLTTRSSFEHRAVAVGTEREQLLGALTAIANGADSPSVAQGSARSSQPPVFCFGGQGSQYPRMAAGLLEASPLFADQIDACEQALSPHVDWSLGEVLREADGAWMERLDIVQPALFAAMVALARLWEACGVRPSLLIGHSQGEVAAAHIAGALSLDDAARVIALRSKAMTKLAGKGAMASVSLPTGELGELLEPYADRISLAAVNGPRSQALSGEPEAIAELLKSCEQEGIRAKRIAVDYAAHSAQIEALEEELLDAFAPIEPKSAEVPLHSTLSGEAIDTASMDASYWYRNLRQTVLFGPVIETLLDQGHSHFLEISPHPVLGFGIAEAIEAKEAKATTSATLRKGEPDPQRFCLSLAEAHANGVEVQWPSYFKGSRAKPTKLPTYPFQRKRYWLAAASGVTDARSIGQSDADHPLLGAAISDPSGEGLTLTGRLSLATHPWLADHAVAGTVLLPGTAFLELALRAAEQLGAEQVQELTLQAPLILPESAAVQIQVSVASPDEDGSREIRIHSRPETGEGEEVEWVLNAEGLLSDEALSTPEPLDAWPPDGAEPLEAEFLYDRLAEAGFEYGPAFQGLTKAWKAGEQVFAEVSLAEEQAPEAARFGLHPALLDCALHATLLAGLQDGEAAPALKLPFSWNGVSVNATGASQLRVGLSEAGEGVSISLADEAGEPVASVTSLIARPVSPEQLSAARSKDGLLGISWQERQLEEAAESTEPELWRHEAKGDQDPTAARQATVAALTAIQAWLAREDPAPEDRLAIITEGAIATDEEQSPDPAQAAIWGLIRSAQSEHPGSFLLIDTDGSEASGKALASALAQSEEPQLALREGKTFVPRATRLTAEQDTTPIDPDKTILITGATGTVGSLTAKHLVKEHGAKNLLLISRQGEQAKGAKELAARLQEQGAKATIAACDASDPGQLKELLDSIPKAAPLGAVFHSAAALDDATIESLTPERLDSVFAPKADGAWALHQLTKDKELSHFVIYSSAAGTLGGPAQGNYAAANSYCDALAQQRKTQGLPASSIAWGYWQTQSDLTAKLTEADHQRLRRGGIAPLTDSQGLALLDQALTSQRPDLLGIAIEPSGLRSMASLGVLPPILSSLIRIPKRRAQAGGSLAKRLAELPEADRPAHVLELLRAETAAVLGHDSAKDIEPSRAFSELGFDSLAALELRNRLSAATGLRLAPTVVFDYPSAEKLAEHLLAEVTASGIAKVAVRSQATDEPIAIVGMSCRYPGGVSSPEELWELLAEGKDAIEPFPTDRGWDLERLYDADPESIGTSYAREGGFLADATEFDPEFFSISPREAIVLDPQQRLLLEGAWEALEDAGIDPASLRGTAAGVYAGVMYQDYGAPQFGISAGMTTSVVSGRVAYALDLEGPAVTVDTACSSSLVALHFASQALRGGECSLAIAGGATVLATPTAFTEFSRQRGLARDGRCKSFAEAADGAGFSEGIGVLVLERLSDAEAKGHPILATIRGSAINQDGASNGLTAPNGPSQERVIRQALANARLTTKDVDMVEAHGTGTTLGDPIEAGALLATYGQERETPLRLGSIKSNIGHTQAAAGVGGVIKAVLAMREGTMPKTLHVDAPSTKVDWEAGEIELLTEAQPWEPNGHPRRAAVSSFGYSGTNAHLILEEAPTPSEVSEGDGGEQPLQGPIPLALSAKSPEALAQSASRLATHLKANPDQDLTDTAYSLLTTRSSFEHRAVAVGEGREQLLDALTAIANGADSPSVAQGSARTTQPPVFCFGGQGSQYPRMAAGLLEASPLFADQIDACEQALSPHVDWSLSEVLREADGAWMERLDIVQPALFAAMVALARLWEACGVRPSLVIGHSQGEVAAAHIAGALSLDDAARVIALRSKAMTKLAGKGAMASVSLPTGELGELLEPYADRISLAAVNGPRSQALSGEPEAIAELLKSCEQEGIRAKRIAVDYAAHSAQIEALEEELLDAFAPIEPKSAEIPLHSTLSGEPIDTASMDASYWYRNLRQTVLFGPVIETLLDQGHSHFLEISPHPVLGFGIAEAIEAKEAKATASATLRKGEPDPQRFCLSLAEAHANGVEVQWPSYFKGSGAKPTKLPTYPFQRKRYWLSAASGPTDARSIGQSDADHPLLGAAIRVAGGEQMLFTGRLSLATHPWLADHAVAGTVLLPGTAFLELALRAAEQLGAEQVQELTLQAPLILPETGAVQIQVSVASPDEDGAREIHIHSRPETGEDEEAEWVLNAEGLLSDEALSTPEPLDAWPPDGAEPLEAEFLYDRLAEAGFEYGPAFQGLTKAWKAGEQVFAEVSLAEEQAPEAARFALHPALLDCALHSLLLAGLGEGGSAPELRLPFSWSGVSLSAEGPSALRVRLSGAQGENVSISLADEAGEPVASVASLIARPVSAEQLSAARSKDGLLGISWQERQLPEAGESPGVETWRHQPQGDQDPTAARKATVAALAAIQAWLQREDPSPEDRLAILTEGAIATDPEQSPDPAQAAIWGLARSAQSEHPASFLLIDSDGSEGSEQALASALAQSEEPQLALREGVVLVPRATRLAPEQEGVEIDPDKTILITGATGTVGSLTAHHLVKEHGAKNLLLISRQGEQAKGAKELAARLQEQGAKATIAACDASDPGQLKELLDSIPKAAPLGAVFHSAAALDDATIDSLTPERLDAAFAPKADGAWALHQLTKDKELSHFVIYSSAAGTLGGPAQGNYAAANSYCDALAQQRKTQGLPATSIAWGYWQTQSDLTAKLTEADHQRLRRSGIAPLTDEQGLALLDQALTSQRPDLLGIAIEPSGLRSMASLGVLPPILSSLIRIPKRRAQSGGSLAKRLAELPEQDRAAHVLELLRAETAAVLGHDSAKDIEPSRAFSELGFDSLAALELRNRLSATTGLRLAPTVVFDYPSAEKLASHLLAEVTASGIAKVAVRSQATDEPIAIVGMSCRYPGGVSSPEELWELLAEGKDAIEPFPTDRGWDLERLYDADPESIGTSYAREGGFLADATDFDPEFFSISPKESLVIDPQQRLLLEGAWEALEDAGIDPASLRGSEAGVFAGVMYQDYGAPQFGISAGMTTSTISGRVAYSLGLEGPAMSVDTACSSSLVALHLASQALHSGECNLALAGGVSVLATPSVFSILSAQRGLSPDGRCKSFAEAADGAGFSEGIGVLVLERLSDAQAKGHPILATIRGSAINQDGATNGFTAPNGPSQERVIRQALANARLTTKDVDMVEAHGTGTTLGDPIEAGALLATYGQEREAPLRLGSLKSNIGHTQAAAGVAGVIKAVLAMREGTMPRTLHVEQPSSKVDWEAGEIELLTEAEPWEANGHPRRAAVSSFGASGTNAHLILEEAPAPAEVKEEDGGEQPLQGPIPLALSAKSPEALAESAERLATHLKANPDQDLTDTAFSLLTTRSSFEHRAVAVGTEREQLLGALTAIANGADSPSVAQGSARTTQPPVFCFGGQGSQYPRMAAGLLEASPLFADRIERCEQALSPHVDWSLSEVLREADGAWMERLDIVQPALFAAMVALARLWEACGVRPSLVIGHSQGEVAAAHIAGALSLDDAARVIALRSKAMTKLAGKGAMASVSLPSEELGELLGPYADRISLAAVNGPRSQALSGEPEAIAELLKSCEQEGIRAKRIAVDYAAHSAQIEALEEELLDAFAPIEPKSAEIPLHSTLSGEPIDTASMDASYWYRNLRQTVLFGPVIETLLDQGHSHFLEISPHPVLGFGIAEAIEAKEAKATASATLRKGEPDPQRFCLSLAEAHANGVEVQWPSYFKGSGAKPTKLPTYPFQRKRYWLSAASGPTDARSIGQSDADHPLLGAAIRVAGGEQMLFTGRLSLATHPWLADHAVAGTVLLPGTAFLELALRAAEQLGAEQVQELTLQAPLILPETGAVQIQVSVASPDEDGAREIHIHSRPETGEDEEAEWVLNAEGLLSDEALSTPEPLDAWPPDGAEPLEAEFLYDRLAEAGFEYGPAFQGLTKAWKAGEQVFAEVSLAEEQAPEAARFALHPALLDCALHSLLLAGLGEGGSAPELRLPFSWSGVSLSAEGPSALRVRLSGAQGENVSISLADEAGEPVASVASLIARPVSAEQLSAARSKDGLLGISWQERQLPEAGESPGVETWRHQPQGDQDPTAARKATVAALAAIQAWLQREDPSPEDRLAILTEGAIATDPEQSPDPAQAAIWGLARSAQSEHPASFLLIDSDGSEGSEQALASALAQSEEPQIALREGKTFVPRATRLTAEQDTTPIDPDKTILITGATGTVGSLTAKHLVKEHGAKNLLLISRQGEQAKGAKELAARLQEQGAKATIAACDASDPGQLKELLDSIPKAAPLGAVFHSAAALDDATIESLTPERLDSVFAPKADGAWALHQLTKDKELSHFVIYSSAAGTLGGPAQGNYAAANSYCDALAQQRKTQGLPATSIAWGYWQTQSDLTAKLTEADHQRLRRSGIAPLTDEQGLALLDQALTSQRPDLLGIAIEPSGLRSMASLGVLPPILSSLIRIPKRRAQSGGSLAKRLAELPEGDRAAHVLELLRAETAAVLGHDSAKDIEPSRAFSELGFDSLAALELRNRLGAATGLRLAPTVVFDYPSAEKLAEHLLAEVTATAFTSVAVRSQATDEPIAIVGMSCRYPGGVSSPEELWELLSEGKDAIEPFPTDRGWDLERLYDADPESIGTSYAREGGFLADATDFDPEFFSISPKESLVIDPQQRLLLEGAWEALEDAGIDPASLRGSEAGVFAGVMYQDYGAPQFGISAGMTTSTISGRVAYSLGLEGPAMSVDTACSSSLVALHLASQALHSGECNLALAGGVSVLATPSVFSILSAQRGLSPDGRCKSFAEAADGAGFSEGIGVLVLERLSDAQAKGHPILATIRGSAINQDGATNGFTAPNGPSQERVIRQALANARLTTKDVDMVEAHGTGTTLGDPIEAGALLATYGQEREAPLRLGSLKSNIGHTQAAAGVAGVIKAVLAMREGTMPRTLHVEQPSSKVDWEAGEIELLTEAEPWEANGHPRRAAVSSFGASGTNAHLILEEAPAPAEVKEEDGGEQPLQGPIPLALSAKSPEALAESAERLATHLQANPGQDLTDTAYSLLTTRSTFEHRAVAVSTEREQLLDALTAIASGTDSPSVAQGSARTTQPPVFCFPGQGSQWQGMAAQLIAEAPLFEHHLSECEEALSPHIEFSLRDVLLGAPDAASSDRIEVIQPALFATMVALARLWEACGAKPAATVGHSQGEIAAAHIAGALSLEDAARIAALRSQLIAKLTGKGAMLSIALGAKELAELLDPYKGQIEIAAQNGPSSTILSAQSDGAAELLAHCEAKGIRAKQIPATIPSHSAMVEPLREELLEALSPLSPRATEIPFHSTVTGAPIDGTDLDAEYWYLNLRQPVLFEAAIAALAKAGQSSFVEISPHPVFALPVQETLEANLPDPSRTAVIGTLRREEGGAERFCLSLAEAHASGIKVDWPSYFKGSRAKPTKLPTYPFQRKRYWLAGAGGLGAGDPSSMGLADADHPLLGAAISDPDGEGLTLTGRLSLSTHPWLADHAVAGTVLLPGTAFLELALRAAEQLGAEQVQELTLQAPLILPESGAVQIQVSVASPDEDGARQIKIHSRPESSEGEEAEWALNAEGLLSEEALSAPEPLDAWPPEGAEPLEAEFLYDRLAEGGFEYGPAFQGLTKAWKLGEQVFAEVSLAEGQAPEATRFGLHPALLDCALHTIVFSAIEFGPEKGPLLPSSWSEVSLSAVGADELRVAITNGEEGISLSLGDRSGAAVARIGSLALRPVSPEQLQGLGKRHSTLIGIEWQERELPTPSGEPEIELWRHEAEGDPGPTAARKATAAALEAIQAWLAREGASPSERLAILTEGAVATTSEESPDPAQAAILGLVRSAQSEHPGGFLLIDTDGTQASEDVLASALAQTEEPQLALREGTAFVPRATVLPASGDSLMPPPGPWRLDSGKRGMLEELALVPSPGALEPLGPAQVRIAMRAVGLSFRDVAVALGITASGERSLGGEGAGVVVEVGAEVDDLTPGDRVMGMLGEAFAPLAIAERALLTRIPSGWSFERAAAVPNAFTTAAYGLIDLAELKPGQRVLVHAGAGGVGMAAIELAQHTGAEVFATASPAKWDALLEAGIAEDHLASSRDLGFKEKFLALTGGEGVDVVLNSLAGEFVDASLGLLLRGGRFLEMGTADIRDPERVADDHPGVSYRAFDLAEAGLEHMGEMLAEMVDMLDRGSLDHSPVTTWDLRRAPEAFRQLRDGSNVGKIVLEVPQPIDPERTVLITGATGALGGATARHLVTAHGARHLLLASRSGEAAPGAGELRGELAALGAEVTVAACDVSDRGQLEQLLDSIPEQHPLGAVFHAAGALDDATIGSLTPERLAPVFAPKVDAAWALHELTEDMGLSAFVIFSSAAGTLGTPGQGNYAAANSYCDALAQLRRAQGLPAASIAWGYWEMESALTAKLTEADIERMRRAGMAPLSKEQGLSFLDQALGAERPDSLAIKVDAPGLRTLASIDLLPPILSDLVTVPKRSSAAAGSLARKLAALPEAEREDAALEAVKAEVAAVLGHPSGAAIEADRPFQDLGFDSLAAVELRNRLNTTSGAHLAATVVFDYPNAAALAKHVCASVGLGSDGGGEADAIEGEFNRLESMLARIEDVAELDRAAARLRELLGGVDTTAEADLADASDEEMFELLDKKLGRV